MNLKILTAALLLVLPAGRAVASSFAKSARGTTTAQFLRLGVGARAIGMGEAYSTLADDGNAIYWNPAALTQIKGTAVTFMHALYLESISFDFAGYGQRVGNHAIGAGVQYLSAGKLPETDMTGAETGSISPSDMAASVGGAYRFGGDRFAVGVAGKYIRSQVVTSAQTFAGDIGIHSLKLFGSKFRASVVASNFGGKLKFDQDSESLPLLIKAGASYGITKTWDLAFEEGFPKDDQPYSALGTEYRMPVGNSYTFSGRAGMNTRTLGEVSGLSGISMGFGIAFKSLSADYAFVPIGELGITHGLSMTFSFGNQLPRERIRRPRIETSPERIDANPADRKSNRRESGDSQKGTRQEVPGWVY